MEGEKPRPPRSAERPDSGSRIMFVRVRFARNSTMLVGDAVQV